jgi:hypothetical protein
MVIYRVWEASIKTNNYHCRSELLHVGKVAGVGDAFHHLVAVLDVLMEILDSRVEDVR